MGELVGHAVKEGQLILAQRFQGGAGAYIVLQMFHEVHATEGREDARIHAEVSERPGRQAAVGVMLFEHGCRMVLKFSQSSAKERLHDNNGDIALGQGIVEVLGVDVFGFYLVGVVPVDIVHLYLCEVPVVLVVEGHHLVELALLAVERPAEVADAAGLAFLEEEVKDTVVDEAFLKVTLAILHAAEGVEQVVVDVVDLQVLERLVVHLDAGLIGPVAEVAHLGGHEPFVARMAAEGDAGGCL